MQIINQQTLINRLKTSLLRTFHLTLTFRPELLNIRRVNINPQQINILRRRIIINNLLKVLTRRCRQLNRPTDLITHKDMFSDLLPVSRIMEVTTVLRHHNKQSIMTYFDLL